MSMRSVNLVIILFLLNASAGLMVASGYAADIGIDLDPGADDELDKANETAQNIQTGSSIGETLFGALAAAAKTVTTIFTVIFIAPLMFNNLGVPTWLTAFVFAPMYIIVGIDVLQVLTGRFG